MPEEKKQHTVPQSVLRAFCHSSSNKLVGTFFMPRGHFFATAKIKDHACDDYFYGKDGVEKWLQRIENGVSPTIQAILTSEQLPVWGSDQHKDLAFFAILQKNRTPAAAAEANEVSTKALKAGLGEEGAESYRAGFRDAGEMAGFPSTPRMLVHFVDRRVPAVLDLRYNLVCNSTSRPFILSDHPVVAYNQFYERQNSGFNDTGLQSRGLQLFFPLSPKHLLVSFDSDVYKIGGPVFRMTKVQASEADVEGLNFLQVVNAEESLFFNDAGDEPYIRGLVAKGETFRRDARGQAPAVPAERFGLPSGKVIISGRVDVKIGLRPSFIKFHPSASRFRNHFAGQRFRNPELIERMTRNVRR
jgi:hypothetical protein